MNRCRESGSEPVRWHVAHLFRDGPLAHLTSCRPLHHRPASTAQGTTQGCRIRSFRLPGSGSLEPRTPAIPDPCIVDPCNPGSLQPRILERGSLNADPRTRLLESPREPSPLETGPLKTGPLETGPLEPSPLERSPLGTGRLNPVRSRAVRSSSEPPTAPSPHRDCPLWTIRRWAASSEHRRSGGALFCVVGHNPESSLPTANMDRADPQQNHAEPHPVSTTDSTAFR